MAAPANDIGTNPFTSDRRLFLGAYSTVSGVKYGAVVIYDTGDNNSRSVKLPTAAGATGVLGIVAEQGDPNSSGAFAVGDEFAVCVEGVAECLLSASAVATKGGLAITDSANGTIKPWVAESKPYDVVGVFAQTKTAGAAPELVSVIVGPYRVQA
jgi:hypothetical protein